jgi:raffinose/stachyose/melibiose transport system permease protein
VKRQQQMTQIAQVPLSQPVQQREAARQARRHRMNRWLISWLFVLPILAINLVVVLGPAVASIYYSFTDWRGIGTANFIGLDNYIRLLNDSAYQRAFVNNLIWMIFFLIIPFVLALLGASMLAPIRGAVGLIVRAALFIPYILPSVVVASIWRSLLSPTAGIGAQLAAVGIPGLDIAFLGNPQTVLLSIAFVDNWRFWGFLMVLLLAAMQSIAVELFESARIDGANRWQEFLHIILPGIRPTLVFMLLMVAIWSFLVFDYVWVLTQGGPAGASEVLGTLVVKNAFQRFDAGYAASIGITMSVFAGVFLLVYTILRRRGWEI